MTALDDRVRALIAQTKSQTPITIPLSDIEQHRTFQKRAASTEANVQRNAIREKEVEVVKKLTADLSARPDHHAEPVTVCDVEGRLVLVDGHHRYSSYRAAQRDIVPARVIVCSESEAHLLATALNTYNATIPLGKEERSEMVWREVVRLHDGKEWAAGLSARKLAGLMGMGSPKTVDRMVSARVELDGEADQMTWKQARQSKQERTYSATERLVGWLTTLEKINAEEPHEQEVLIELFRTWNKEYISKEELAERFAPYLESPKAFQKYLEADMGEF
ncbi:ParB N-terminal domain-containing protein [Marinobacter shengliensis]|uniref:ParB N-terminal domain-containing protein n=1 Tax=Marinobacter shengliensis TaxID=1389223 RepID=UPI002573088D|nr:ParB N-terminal domain-containing protein [Marinobacter shengliensis]BEH13587.1 hypothetical protein MAALD49_09550 [Marinobacter shengliensis]